VAYANDFKMLMYLTIAVMPLVFFIKTSGRGGNGAVPANAHAMD
jgi:hypothetical protein